MTCSKVLSECLATEWANGRIERGVRAVVQISASGMLVLSEKQECVGGLWVIDRAIGFTRAESRVLVDFLEGVVW